MSNYLISVADDEEIRQGDLIRRLTRSNAKTEWGFVLTADCDITQKKAGDRYTFLEVVSAEDYLENVWAPGQLKRVLEKQLKAAAEQLTSVMKRSGLKLGISADALLAWLKEKPVSEIEVVVNRSGKPLDPKLASTLTAL